ncbi:autotransporter outer membrane beta-barrel domain-containing protein [Bartonella sp. WD16.2]|uniref:autotransporter outer membrane beta-barrel domain-containing protein n=1 Tax=Bartonella sp. WD16.2 TaxID=1933904 RepID=UPI0009995775|nr:autotransporter outer membrane beta-barrel domain-containing protein [Bartonella sp. WD16.2]AQX20284.1 outer membrane autotransporter barrel domain-containing protein [Bartonella sp. WD16.2]
MRKKGLLLCTVSGFFLCYYYNTSYAQNNRDEAIIADGSSQKKIEIEKNISDFYTLSARNGGSISGTNINAIAGQVGVLISDGTVSLKNSTVSVERGVGITFFSYAHSSLKESEKKNTNTVAFFNTKLSVKNGMGILGPMPLGDQSDDVSSGTVFLKNSEIEADVLIKNRVREEKNKAILILTADHSILKGGTRILREKDIDDAIENNLLRNSQGRIQVRSSSDTSLREILLSNLKQTTVLNLKNNSKWILKISQTETNARDKMLGPIPTALILGIAERSRSDISVLNLNDSTVAFESPTEGHYQTLYVGSGVPGTSSVYNARGDVKLHLNTDGQKADRVFVKGDVSGSTIVSVDINENVSNTVNLLLLTDSLPLNRRGISLIQVSGQAAESSFKLASYITIKDLPYKYVLNAYGPESRNGLADIKQKLPGVLSDVNRGTFWDFRLQNQYLPNSNIKALVPQMANYLVMPNALFSAGFTDIENQNTLLANIRTMPWEMKSNKKNSFFLSSYGNKATLSSNRTALEYSYGADISYGAIQTGVALAALEGQSTSSYFGLLGTYGKLSFTPQNMADVKKTTLNKWTFTAYSSIQHNDGVYVNMLLSYGLLRGNISNAIIGQTASVDDAKTWGASATLGKQLATSIEGLVFEPQTQIAYQQLMFRTIKDVDKFKVDMGSPYQWSARMGGRLVKNVNQFEDGRTLSFYGKLNLISIFGDGGTIQAGKKSFYFDPIGPAIEGGIGFNAELIQNVTFRGDITYQQKLQKAGLSGAIFSGTLRYRF